MIKFDNEWYNKGYEDGFSDAINNLELNDILQTIEKMSIEEVQQVEKYIKKKI